MSCSSSFHEEVPQHGIKRSVVEGTGFTFTLFLNMCSVTTFEEDLLQQPRLKKQHIDTIEGVYSLNFFFFMCWECVF